MMIDLPLCAISNSRFHILSTENGFLKVLQRFRYGERELGKSEDLFSKVKSKNDDRYCGISFIEPICASDRVESTLYAIRCSVFSRLHGILLYLIIGNVRYTNVNKMSRSSAANTPAIELVNLAESESMYSVWMT